MPYRDLAMWDTFFAMEGGYPEERQDYRLGLLSSQIHNFHSAFGKTRSRPLTWETFSAMHARGIPLDAETQSRDVPIVEHTTEDVEAMNRLLHNIGVLPDAHVSNGPSA